MAIVGGMMSKKSRDIIVLNAWQAVQICVGFSVLQMIPDFGSLRLMVLKAILSWGFLVVLAVWVFKNKL
jgi:hypothetical protein